jgi:uncharacterized protein YuzE
VHEPIGVKIDRDVEAGYVRYRRLATGERVARTQRFGDDVNVDYNDVDDVLGIEILAFDHPTLAVARAVAAKHGLVFPRDLVDPTVMDRRKA